MIRIDLSNITYEALRALLEPFTTVDPLTKCHIWTGSKAPYGYGTIPVRPKRTAVVHRAVFESIHGKQPRGVVIMHTCDSPSCWNPGHLKAGTQADNNRDCVAKGRHAQASATHCKRGHEFTVENTKITPQGWRKCRACLAAYKAPEMTKPRSSGHCKHGHAYTLENTYQEPNGGRKCRTCMRERLGKRRALILKSGGNHLREVHK